MAFEKTFAVTRAHLAAIADDLDVLQSVENDGRGVRCVQQMITYLRRNEFERARGIYQADGDKTRQYPKLEAALREYFGCRIHGHARSHCQSCCPGVDDCEKCV
jgi:hypothetical protein